MSQPSKMPEITTERDSVEPVGRSMPGRLGIGFNVLIQLVLTLLLFAGANYLSYRYYKRWDLTASGSHSLSSVTLNYLRKLSKDVEVTMVFPRNSELQEPVRALLEEYQRYGKRRVKVEGIDPLRDVDRAEQLKVETGLTLTQNGILLRTNKRQKYILEEDLLVRNASKEGTPVVGFRGEDAVTSGLIGLLEGTQKKLYMVVGKGSRSQEALEGAGQSFANLAKQQNFDLQVLNLAGVQRIPEDASALLLVGLRYDLSERELGMLREFWRTERAGLLVLLDPNASTPRLNALLSENGITPRSDRVLVAESTSAGMRKEFAVEVEFSPASAVSQPLVEAMTVLPGQTQSLALPPGDDSKMREQGLRVTALMRAADRFWGEREFLDALPVADAATGDTVGDIDVAASVERGDPSDDRLRVVSSRMVVVGNAEMLNPETMLAEASDFAALSVNWIINRERLMGIPWKPKNAYRIQLNGQQNKTLFTLTTFLMPGLVLMAGWLVWLTRRSA
jgi:ABC-type uncharacterized transport system